MPRDFLLLYGNECGRIKLTTNEEEIKMGNFIITNDVLTKYTGKGRDVVIPDSVTSIGFSAFRAFKK